MKALVTGGGGFLGGAIVRQLLARGDTVRSLARGPYPDLTARGVEVVRGDLGDLPSVLGAAAGCDVVFHVAAKAGIWGKRADFERANVDGTRNVIEACRQHGVSRLVHTSSPSVVHGGGPLEGVDESIPYAAHYDADYTRTKAIAEQLVLAANGPALRTVALRPHLIWGPGDTQLVPRIVARAKAGQLRIVGDGRVLVDSVYIDNAAEAHLNAADRLATAPDAAGKAFFITNGEPWPIADLINGILAAAGVAPVTKTISPKIAWFAGLVLEGVHRTLGREEEPRMTRFLAHQLSTAHWFDISAARRELGYVPRVSIREGLARLKKSFAAG